MGWFQFFVSFSHINTYRIIAKTSRAYTKMSTLMIRLIIETLLNSINMFFAILVGSYTRQACAKGRLIVKIIWYVF